MAGREDSTPPRKQLWNEVEPLAFGSEQIDALRRTIEGLGGILRVEQAPVPPPPAGGLPPKFYVPSGFCSFACETQGYVRRVVYPAVELP